MAMITEPRVGGLALIIGAVLYILATFITPGYLIGNATASDVYGLVDALADHALLAAFTAVLSCVGLVFLFWGLTVMWQTAQNKCALDTFVKFGLVGVMIALVFLMFGQLANLATSHAVDHGVGFGAGPDQTEILRTFGVQLQLTAGVARLVAAFVGLTGYVVLGFALARKFRPGLYRILALIVGIGAVFSLIGFVLTEPFHELVETLGPILTSLSLFYLIWWIVIGVGVYQERFGLKVGTTPEH